MIGPTVVVVGSLNVDRSVSVEHFPRAGETVLGHDLRIDNGGKGANQAVAAARLGAEVAMIGAVGADADGSRLRQALIDEGVDASAVATASEPTGTALITVDGTGENSIVVAAGANTTVTADAISAAESIVAEADIVLAQFEIPSSAVEAAARVSRGTFMLNPAPARQVLDWVGMIDVLVPNRGELATMVGQDIGVSDDLAEAARTLGIPTVVVTLGGEGALVVTDDRTVHVPALEVTVVDTTAAGDSFCGAMAVALGRGADAVEAARFAVECAALTVTRRGAQASLPRAEDIE